MKLPVENYEFPRDWKVSPVSDVANFSRGVSWGKAEEAPEGKGLLVISIPNIKDGWIDYDSKFNHYLSKEVTASKRLNVGDIVFVGSSGSIHNVGRNARVSSLPNGSVAFASFTFKAAPKPKAIDGEFFYYLVNSEMVPFPSFCKRAADGKFNFQLRDFANRLAIPLPPLPEQKKIAHIISTVQRAIEAQERIIQTTTELKKALMHKLFTEGLRNESQKHTEIGPVPESWETPTVESVCAIKASAMSYSQLENAPNVSNGVRVIGIKVSDMNLPGNEIELHAANLERQLPEKEALKRTVPANSIVFPKRGAAIATNKKRLTTGYTVLDPNLIAVMPTKVVNHRYLFHWFNTFDLKKITDPGPTPQLNRKDIAPLKFPMPSVEEQEAIAAAIDAAEEKSTLHARKRDQLQDLFRTLLHELMTAKTRVHAMDFQIQN